MTKSQLRVKQTCLSSIISNVTNNKNELWRTVELTTFQKPQLQCVSILFTFDHPCLLSFYLRCYLCHLVTFLSVFLTFHLNRSLALRGHVTNTSLKQSLGILLMPKIDRAHKNSLTPEIWEENHLRKIFYGTLIFQQSSMICIGRHVGRHTLALQYGGQNYFLLTSC